ncbi:MAG: L,D-transpeptidase family protein [Sphingomicrobium sp.]
MTNLRKGCTGRRSVHHFSGLTIAAALCGALFAIAPATAGPAKAAAAKSTPAKAHQPPGQSVDDFYQARKNAPLWLAAGAGTSADDLVALLRTSWIDGLSPENYRPDQLQSAIFAARGGNAKAVMTADRALSEAFVAFARDLARQPVLDVQYVDVALKPAAASPRALLLTAASVKSLPGFVLNLEWMNPIYAQLRRALVEGSYSSERERAQIAVNLGRARALPGGRQPYILVNAAQQRLYAYDNRALVDSMRVVVGKPKYPTPMMAAYVRFAALNPYWYVPPDLASERIAPNVVRRGLPYLAELGYEVLTAWDDNAVVIDPATIDWKKVAAGEQEVLIRQQPGPHNSMGRMKFMFPNSAGIYLHDNPERELFNEAARLYSGGCVRLEDAARLGRWLFGRELEWEGAEAEERVPLPQPVPVYITYLTAVPEGTGIAFFDDVYNRDGLAVAAKPSDSPDLASSR